MNHAINLHYQASLVQKNKGAPHSVVSVTNRCGILVFWSRRHQPAFLAMAMNYNLASTFDVHVN